MVESQYPYRCQELYLGRFVDPISHPMALVIFRCLSRIEHGTTNRSARTQRLAALGQCLYRNAASLEFPHLAFIHSEMHDGNTAQLPILLHQDDM
jgi:hypothetical protein